MTEETVKMAIQKLNLNSTSHSRGLLLLRGQLLVFRSQDPGERPSECYFRSTVRLIPEEELKILRLLYSEIPHYYKKQEYQSHVTRFPRNSKCKYVISDPKNITVCGSISDWSKMNDYDWFLFGPNINIGVSHFLVFYMLAAMLQHGILTSPRLPSGIFGAALV